VTCCTVGAVEAQWLIIGRHMNVRVRAALVSAVLHKSFSVDSGPALRDGLGKLMNLVSVDIGVSHMPTVLSYQLYLAAPMILCLNVLCAYAVVWWFLLLLLLAGRTRPMQLSLLRPQGGAGAVPMRGAVVCRAGTCSYRRTDHHADWHSECSCAV
jgi:hypothetical protein